jgi:hypothetical protein
MLTPLRWVVHSLSTIWLAVIFLAWVALYAVAASIPVGVLFKAPTYAFYGLTLLAAVAVLALLPTWVIVRVMRSAGAGRAARFATGFIAVIGLTIGAAALWGALVWPHLNYNQGKGTGVLFFAEFINHYKDVTIRRLPGVEMTELEFYAWWPLTVPLLLFVVNMFVATVRRIEFRFENIGVLTVHAGIITMALGSAYYSVAKLEGDTILAAGQVDPATGQPAPGPPVGTFFDNTRVVLNVAQRGLHPGPAGPGKMEPRLLRGLPRYNEYNLGAARLHIGDLEIPPGAPGDDGRTLDIPVPSNLIGDLPPAIDTDLRVRVVGYAPVTERQIVWDTSGSPGEASGPARLITAQALRRAPDGTLQRRDLPRLFLGGASPADAADALFDGLFVVRLSRDMPQERWDLLRSPTPASESLNALHVSIPGQRVSKWFPIAPGSKLALGDPAWSFEVRSISPAPSLPIVTPGYENATSTEVVVRVTPPERYIPPGAAEPLKPFDRFLFARYPELDQDIGLVARPDGRPSRTPPTPLVGLTHLDTSIVTVFIDEQTQGATEADNPPVRAIVRLPGKDPVVLSNLRNGSTIPVGDPEVLVLKLAERFPAARKTLAPFVVPTIDRRDQTGTHRKAMAAVRVEQVSEQGEVVWSQTRWVPFSEFEPSRQFDIASFFVPGGRIVDVTFGRLRHALPGLELTLLDFEMIPYPHSTQPRDFRSDVRVDKIERDASGREVSRVSVLAHTSLNDPLLISPFTWSDSRSWLENAKRWLADRLGPTRFKFSQAGWDADGWNQSVEAAKAGLIKRPVARFTRLGVGNNPGIYVIAGGAIMMSLGIPWAFYVKPLILRRRKAKIQAQLSAGTYVPPGRVKKSIPSPDRPSAGASA